MFVELALGILAGLLCGIFTGLIPGIHINLVIVSVIPFFVLFPSNILVAFVISIAVTHTFLDTLPSVYLGAPDEDTVLSTLPGHAFLKMGQGHQAVMFTLIGSVIAILILPLVTILFFVFVPLVFPFVERMLGWFLLQFSILLIYFERGSRTISFIIFLLAGFLGVASLNLPVQEPLLPLLGGLFGTSTLVYSLRSRTEIPKQIISKPKIDKKELLLPSFATAIIAPICSFFPGLGSSQAAIISSRIFGNTNRKQFLVLIGATNTLVMCVSFVTILLIQKARTGAANALLQIPSFSFFGLPLILGIIFVTSIIAIPITIFLSKIMASYLDCISYSKISLGIIVFISCMVLFYSGMLGFIILVSSTILGLTCMEFGVRKGLLMGSLLIPTILFYVPF